MSRSYWIEHHRRKILYIDFSNTDHDGVRQAIVEARPIIAAQPRESILCLVETAGTKFSLDIARDVKEFTAHNKPFMKMTALVGIDGLQKVMLNSVLVATGRRNLAVKSSREEALTFLASQ